MGRNFMSICHVHKVKWFYMRGEERLMHKFYKQHDSCMRQGEVNVGTFDDQMQESLIPEFYEEFDAETELPTLQALELQTKRRANTEPLRELAPTPIKRK